MKRLLSPFILNYLRLIAKLQIKKFDPVIIGVTGSAGKTSARKAIGQVVSLKGKVKESLKSNSESGIPLNILGIYPYNYTWIDWLGIILLAPIKLLTNWKSYDYYIVEMGIDSPYKPKNMSYLLSILKPHIGIVLNTGLTHTETFDHLVKDRSIKRRQQKLISLIAQEKGKLVTTMSSPLEVAILNYDQKEVRDLLKQTKARVITFGKQKLAKVQITSISSSKNQFTMKIKYKGFSHTLKLKDINLENNYAYTFAAAITTGISLGIPPQKSIMQIEKHFQPPPGRWTIFEGINNTHVIDSSYNASPLTMHRALKDLKSIAGRTHKIAVLGDMRELGQESKQAHKDLAIWAARSANNIFLFGELTKKYTLPILEGKNKQVTHFDYIDDLINSLTDNLKPNSWILVKGSQNTILLERAVESLLKNKSDISKLPRRGNYWNKVREKTP